MPLFPCLQFVGPLLIGGEPQPLPEPLGGLLEAAGPAGAVYASFGTTFRPRTCDAVQGLAAALSAVNRTALLNVNPAHFPGGCPSRTAAMFPAAIACMAPHSSSLLPAASLWLSPCHPSHAA